MEPMDRSSFTVEAMIRGYHVYRDAYQEIWAKNDYSIRVRISESNAKSLNLTPKPIQAYSCPVTCGTQKSAGMMLECVCSIKKQELWFLNIYLAHLATQINILAYHQ